MGILLSLWLISGCLLFTPFIFLLFSNRKTKTMAVKYLDKIFAVLIGLFCAMGGIFLISKTHGSIIGIIAGLLILLFGLSLIWVGIRMKISTSSWTRWWREKCESLDDGYK
jgi:hypothetical protein